MPSVLFEGSMIGHAGPEMVGVPFLFAGVSNAADAVGWRRECGALAVELPLTNFQTTLICGLPSATRFQD